MFGEKKQKKKYTGVRDEIREQQKKTKDMTPKERLAYFWFYYKVPFIAGIAAVIFLSVMIHDMITAKDYNFYALMLNSQNLNDTAISESFSEYADLDNEKYECYIDTMTTLSLKDYTQYDMATYQKIIAQAATNDFDALVLDSAVFYKLSISGFMVDLRTVLSEEELAAYEGNIYYIDQAAIDRADEADSDDPEATAFYSKMENATNAVIKADAEEHKHPENMEEPVPVGIYIEDSPFIEKTDSYHGLIPVFGIASTSQRMDKAASYLSYLYDESIPFETMVLQ